MGYRYRRDLHRVMHSQLHRIDAALSSFGGGARHRCYELVLLLLWDFRLHYHRVGAVPMTRPASGLINLSRVPDFHCGTPYFVYLITLLLQTVYLGHGNHVRKWRLYVSALVYLLLCAPLVHRVRRL